MSETSPEAAAEAVANKGKKSGPMKWIVIGVVAVLVLGGGGAAAWWFLLRTPPPVEGTAGEGGGEGAAPAATAAKPVGEGLVTMDQFLVNLADKEASRFVRVKLGLVVETKKEGEELSKEEIVRARLRSAILEVLAQETSDKLTTPEGKEELKKLIVERANKALRAKKVLDVLFTDFVVQF
jgi:flagellar protein FliL